MAHAQCHLVAGGRTRVLPDVPRSNTDIKVFIDQEDVTDRCIEASEPDGFVELQYSCRKPTLYEQSSWRWLQTSEGLIEVRRRETYTRFGKVEIRATPRSPSLAELKTGHSVCSPIPQAGTAVSNS
jgi:hypothetical protein